MRIIAGSLKGRRLTSPSDESIRPTSDRTRESIFNLLMHGYYGGESIIDQHVLDICCGTGALGLEAISRGAARVTFVDTSKKSIALARDNALHCGVSSKCHFIQIDARQLGRNPHEPAALMLIDAPYDAPLLKPIYAQIVKGHWLRPGSIVLAELPFTQQPPELEGTKYLEMRKYGKATVHLWEVE